MDTIKIYMCFHTKLKQQHKEENLLSSSSSSALASAASSAGVLRLRPNLPAMSGSSVGFTSASFTFFFKPYYKQNMMRFIMKIARMPTDLQVDSWIFIIIIKNNCLWTKLFQCLLSAVSDYNCNSGDMFIFYNPYYTHPPTTIRHLLLLNNEMNSTSISWHSCRTIVASRCRAHNCKS